MHNLHDEAVRATERHREMVLRYKEPTVRQAAEIHEALLHMKEATDTCQAVIEQELRAKVATQVKKCCTSEGKVWKLLRSFSNPTPRGNHIVENGAGISSVRAARRLVRQYAAVCKRHAQERSLPW